MVLRWKWQYQRIIINHIKILTSRLTLTSILNSGKLTRFGNILAAMLHIQHKPMVTIHWNHVINMGASNYRKNKLMISSLWKRLQRVNNIMTYYPSFNMHVACWSHFSFEKQAEISCTHFKEINNNECTTKHESWRYESVTYLNIITA